MAAFRSESGVGPFKALGVAVGTTVLIAVGIWISLRSASRYDEEPTALTPARMAARRIPVPLLQRPRATPIQVRPHPGLAHTVREQDLVAVLCAGLPWWSPPSVPSAYHELKL
jgi:hypothetical protein